MALLNFRIHHDKVELQQAFSAGSTVEDREVLVTPHNRTLLLPSRPPVFNPSQQAQDSVSVKQTALCCSKQSRRVKQVDLKADRLRNHKLNLFKLHKKPKRVPCGHTANPGSQATVAGRMAKWDFNFHLFNLYHHSSASDFPQEREKTELLHFYFNRSICLTA